MASQKARVEDADEDLDDLDDVLEQFTPAPPKPAPQPASSKPVHGPISPPQAAPDVLDLGLDDADLGDDFAKELAKGMESLMREIGGGTVPGIDPGLGGGEADEEREKAFRAAWEALLVEGMDGSPDIEGLGEPLVGGIGAKDKEKAKAKTGEKTGENEDFQRTIRAAMDKLKSSESSLNDKSSVAGVDTDSLEALLAQLGDLGEGEGDEDLAGMLESMMGQLMSKDVLYEPLKELSNKFPSYLADHPELPPDEKTRYESQLDRVQKIVKIFEDPGYRDDNKDSEAKIVGLMNDMQSFGSPPSEIMGPLPPGFNMGADGSPEGCIIA